MIRTNNILKFLLVEDEPIAQIIGQNIIEKAGYKLDIVNSTKKAFNLLQHQKYDLIFMDLCLPGISGIEFTKVLVKKLKVETPIIAITAFNSHSKKDECLKNGFKAFLEKPFTEKQLQNIINKFCLSYISDFTDMACIS